MAENNNLIWIDFENSPHVWVFKEIIKKLESNGLKVLITARDFAQTIELCKYLDIHFEPVKGKKATSSFGKLFSVAKRALALKRYLIKNNLKPGLAISHGSRSQSLAAYFMKVPSVTLDDYEFSFSGFNRFAKTILTPFAIDKSQWGEYEDKVVNYPGLKENLYLCNSENYANYKFGEIDNNKINIIFRPESSTSHYKSDISTYLQEKIIDNLFTSENVFVILIPRNPSQKEYFEERFKKSSLNYFVPDKVINGPALIWNCDTLVGGGGTMTREACVLNVPSYCFFGGKIGGVDENLIKQGKLFMIKNDEDINKIKFVKRENKDLSISNEALDFVCEYILNLIN
ncbi:MAG: DUF354 domain-containing protein [Ignavibacteriae bacterium]|nr:DUF354 domain-containing protein [Ignavibacteriota bacterium]